MRHSLLLQFRYTPNHAIRHTLLPVVESVQAAIHLPTDGNACKYILQVQGNSKFEKFIKGSEQELSQTTNFLKT